MRAAWRALAAGALLWCPAACLGTDSGRYEDCADEAAAEALERARQLITRGEHAGALPHLRRALAACPERVRTHLLYVETVARAEEGAAEPGAATADMRRYYRDSYDDRSPIWPYLQARLAEHDAVREEYLEKAIERDRGFHWAYLSLARLWRSHDRTSRALHEIDRALAAREAFPEARLERAEVLVELGRFEEAAAEYANYVRARPGDRAVLRDYARLLIYELGRTDLAYGIVADMLEDDPDSVDARMNMAAIAWRAGKPEEAVQRYREVLELDPNQELAVLNLGNLHFDAVWREGSVSKKESWVMARKAYRYYLNMTRNRTEDRYDFWDHHFAVPNRLKQIEQLLGEEEREPPRLGEF